MKEEEGMRAREKNKRKKGKGKNGKADKLLYDNLKDEDRRGQGDRKTEVEKGEQEGVILGGEDG